MKNRFLGFSLVIFLVNYLSAEDLFLPLPQSIEFHKKKVNLGKKLFLDNRLSKDNTISCASCHSLENYGVDSLKTSFGINAQVGSINAPTVYNSRYNFVQFWDGRAKNLHEQAKGPIVNPIEMGSSFDEVISKLSKDDSYKLAFSEIYGDGITIENIANAISEFEKTLLTPDSKFDKFLRKEINLSKEEAKGFDLFKSKGCIACHNGINIGGNLFQKIGIFGKFEKDEDVQTHDLGRFNVTKKESDKFYFKVPSLRNVAKTAPYFHDGSIKTLEEAVKKMAYHQLGRDLKKDEVYKIVKFLETLTGEISEK